MEALSVGLAEINGPGVRRLRVHDPSSPSPGTLGPSPLIVHPVFCVGAGRHDPDVRTITKGAPKLLSRIQVDARVFANADATMRNLRYGRRSWAPRSGRDPRVLVAKGSIPHRRRRLLQSHTEDAP